MRRKSGGTLFVCLDMADLATIGTFPLRSLVLLACDDRRAGRGPRGTSTSCFGWRCCGNAFGLLAGKASLTVSFETGKLQGKSATEYILA